MSFGVVFELFGGAGCSKPAENLGILMGGAMKAWAGVGCGRGVRDCAEPGNTRPGGRHPSEYLIP